MFSEACVKNSVHRGRGMRGEGATCGEVRGGPCVVKWGGQTATEAGGTNPTGIHPYPTIAIA